MAIDTFYKPCSEEFYEFAKRVTHLIENESELQMLRHECDVHNDKEACDLELQRIDRKNILMRGVENNADEFVRCLGKMLKLAVAEVR